MSQPSFELDLVDDGGVPTLSVGELAEAINGALRRSFADGVWVRTATLDVGAGPVTVGDP